VPARPEGVAARRRGARWLALALLAPVVPAAAAYALPAPLVAATTAHPGMRVLEAVDLRDPACRRALGAHPGWIEADLDGDGRPDFGALLVDARPSRIVRFDGRDYPVYAAQVLLLLGRAGGRYEERLLYDFSDALPTSRGLLLEPPHRIRDVQSQRSRTLRQPALTFLSCGQFSVVYAWDGKNFVPMKTADKALGLAP